MYGVLVEIHNHILRPKYLRWFSFIISALLKLAFSPGSVIVYFVLYFKTAVTPEKGIENLRVAVSSNGTFGDFQAKNLVLISEKRTKSTTTTGIKGTTHPIYPCYWVTCFFSLWFSFSGFLSFFSSLFSCAPFHIFLSQIFTKDFPVVLLFVETVIFT